MLHGDFFLHFKKSICKLYHKMHPVDPRVRFLDDLCLIASVLMPFSAIPQIYKLYVFQNPQGVSILMWVFYAVLCIPMLFYGIVHKVKPLIILNALWLIAEILMIVGLIVYG